MRITLLTLAVLLLADTDAQVMLLFMGLLPAAGTLFVLAFLLAPAARRRPVPVSRDNSRWTGVHRRPRRALPPGRHTPARGRRLEGVSRQAQLEERTEQIDPRPLLAEVLKLQRDQWALREGTEAWLAAAHAHEPYRDGLRLRCRSCKLDLDQPEGMPEVGAGGMQTWTRG
jgi:hypothetical protein